jgi:hypothetical protein
MMDKYCDCEAPLIHEVIERDRLDFCPHCGRRLKSDYWNQKVRVTPGGLKMTRAAIRASIRKNCPGDDE